MSEKNLYYPLWKKYLPVLIVQMKNAVYGTKQIKMSKAEFEIHGNRTISNYFINLEIKNGKAANNISGSAVARDLFDILNSEKLCKEMFTKNNYKICMGKSFILEISII
jgi:hypothetical protein